MNNCRIVLLGDSIGVLNMQGDISRGAFSLLHSQLVAYVPFTRLNPRAIALSVPSTNGTVQSYEIPYFEAEHRPLCIFDGEIPQDGVAQCSRQLMSQELFPLAQSPHHTRKTRDYQLEIPLPKYLVRRFLIFPQGKGTLMRFHKKTLARRFSTFELRCVQDTVWQYTSHSATA